MPDPDVRSGCSVVHQHAQLVFTTQYRPGALTGPILTPCEEIMRAVCADFGGELHEFNGEIDQAHLVVH
ncbi:hypothetical protein Cci01nite_45110 [Catellatospora citrea]|uniref:Transposase IS200-like domain-containing protein n=1 Tax=Catellatospora citrea TaxID=53366 RepID=A0A8J3P0K7_9ACTN|nr:hypothetical protein Cci01nite_45110 [Catellatospora citrea]